MAILRTANNDGQLPIHLAAEKNHARIVLKFLELDPTLAHAQETRLNRNMVLHYAIKNANEELVNILIYKYKVNVIFSENCIPAIDGVVQIQDLGKRNKIEQLLLQADPRTKLQAKYSKYSRRAMTIGMSLVITMILIAILVMIVVMLTRGSVNQLIMLALLPPAAIGVCAVAVGYICNAKLRRVAKNNPVDEKTPLLKGKVINELDEDLEKQPEKVSANEVIENLNSVQIEVENNTPDISKTPSEEEESESVETETTKLVAPITASIASNQNTFFNSKVYSVAGFKKNESLSINDYEEAQGKFDATENKTSDFGC